ncbi:hypothetical protein M1116_01090 [Patescibacteria group bacterium]|nr:hypothetical protein [Patescibacteria group bacterium]
MSQPRTIPIDQFAESIHLNAEQTKAVKEYIVNLLLDNLRQMKEEYNQEIDTAIKNLSGYPEQS